MRGRADIFEWWVVTIIADLIAQIAAVIAYLWWNSSEALTHAAALAMATLAVLGLWISLAATFRRLRDRGRPLWTFLLGLVPPIGWLWLIVECGFLPSAYTGPKRTLIRRTVQSARDA